MLVGALRTKNRKRWAGAWWNLLLLITVSCATGEHVGTSDASQAVEAAADASVTTAAATTVPTRVSNTVAPITTAPAVSATATTATAPTETPTTSPTTQTTAVTTAVPTTVAATTTTLPDDLTIVEVVIGEGKAISEGRVEVPFGNRILMRFDADARLVVHIHGYDEEFSVEAGVQTVHEFEANLPGIFEVEDHVTHRLLIELKVSP